MYMPVLRYKALTANRCVHGFWSAGSQPAQTYHPFQLPGYSSAECQGNNSAGKTMIMFCLFYLAIVCFAVSAYSIYQKINNFIGSSWVWFF